MTIGRRLIKNLASLTIAEVAIRILGTLLTIIVARFFSVSEFGALGVALAFASYLNLFTDFGLTTFAIREISKNKSEAPRLVPAILATQGLIACLLLAILLIAIPFLPFSSQAKELTLLYGLGILPSALNVSYLFVAWERMELLALSKIAMQGGVVGLGFLIVFFYHNIAGLPLAQFISAMVASLAMLFYLRHDVLVDWRLADWSIIPTVLRQSWPFLVSALAVQIYMNSDVIFLQILTNQEIVGFYSAAYKIILLLITAGAFLNTVSFPLLASSHQSNPRLFKELLLLLSRVSGIVSLPLVVGGILLANLLVVMVYGDQYAPASGAFALLLPIIPVMFLNAAIGSALAVMGKQRKGMIAACVGAGLNILLNIILIPKYGMLGAATATLVAELAVLGVNIRYFFKAQGSAFCLRLLSGFFARNALPCGVMGGVVWLALFSTQNLLLLIPLGTVTYIVCLIIFKSVTREDLGYVRRLFRPTAIARTASA
jgi:O-antigen/teichoic acid export membrane protein